jgi:hypothetical protein
MANRLNKYLNKQQNTKPIISKQEVHNHTDSKIDQDFPGFPYGLSKEDIITPVSPIEKKVAAVDNKDGEKMNAEQINEAASDASGSAFEATEQVKE